ncbi:ABC transporter ATP-binding protein [Anaerolineales bacterium]
MGVSDVKDQLLILALITLVIWILESLFEYAHQIYWRNLAQTIQHDLRIETYAHVQNLELAYFEDQSTGGLMSILNNDINELERFLDNGANSLIQITTAVIIIAFLFFLTAPQVAWLTFVPIPVIVYGSIKFQHYLTPRYDRVREQVSALNSLLSNNLSGIATIKSFTAEDYEIDRLKEQSDLYKDANRAAIVLSSAFSPLIRMAVVFGFIAILIFGGFLVIEGQLEIGIYSILIFMTQRLLWPLTSLGQTLDQYQRAMASTKRIFNILDTKPHIYDGTSDSLAKAEVQGKVCFENVNFGYSNGLTILNDLNFCIPSGDTVAIVGATGAGKSTIIKLLLRFYDVIEGRITLDDHDIRNLTRKDLRASIGLVSQDVYLFHGTIKENISYGSFDAPIEAIIEAAKVAEAHDFILSLPEGYDTVVGERGQKLSGGQRQRISIARAILKNPPILIFDEATSSVDNETEAAIQRSLEKIVIGRTTIMIAHRLSTIRNADTILVLENGQLIESGTHETLIKNEGIYNMLWRVQTGEKILL